MPLFSKHFAAADTSAIAGIPKPKSGESCNGCGYCCTAEPCRLARDYLQCTTGPCVALEQSDGRAICGLVRNPLAYMFKAANPGAEVALLDAAPDVAAGKELSEALAIALGIGKGCDADDDARSAVWPLRFTRVVGEPS